MNAFADVDAFPSILSTEEPFAHLSLELQHQLDVYKYVAAATTGMFVWELALDTYNIYRILFKNRMSIPNAVYILSRISTMCFNVLSLPFLTDGEGCKPIFLALTIFWVFAWSLTAMLFLFRIWALFQGQTVIIGFFTFLWLCVIGGAVSLCLVDAPVSRLSPSGSSCLLTVDFPAFEGAGIIIPAVFDTLVFFAISLRLFPWYEMESQMGWGERATFFFCGNGHPQARLSKALLQSGQQYYLLSVIANIFALVLYFTPSVPPPYHVMVAPITISIINSMACKVYCDIKFGRTQALRSSTLLSNIVFLPSTDGEPNLPSSLRVPRIAVPPEVVTSNMRTARHPVTTGSSELKVIVGAKRGHDSFGDSLRGSKIS